MKSRLIFIYLILILSLKVNAQDEKILLKKVDSNKFNKVWYDGKAEINLYELNQFRYQDKYKGEAIMIFVTEDFSKKQQVKSDYPNHKESVKVLKLNALRRFNTGFYSYATMKSVFSPIKMDNKYIAPIKITFSNQDWCGQTFVQYNLKDNKYKFQLNSYFQIQSDKQLDIDLNISEDGIFNQIRLSPNSLPTGDINIYPSAIYNRFNHVSPESYLATANISNNDIDQAFENCDNCLYYQIKYKKLDRIIKVVFENKFPYSIKYWTEGSKRKPYRTKAKLISQRYLPYWQLNKPDFFKIRKEMGFKN